MFSTGTVCTIKCYAVCSVYFQGSQAIPVALNCTCDGAPVVQEYHSGKMPAGQSGRAHPGETNPN